MQLWFSLPNLDFYMTKTSGVIILCNGTINDYYNKYDTVWSWLYLCYDRFVLLFTALNMTACFSLYSKASTVHGWLYNSVIYFCVNHKPL